MKKIFTFFLGLIAALGTQAQSDFPLQFADKNGNIFEDGTVLNLTEAEAKAGCICVWKTLEEALEIFGRYEDFHKTNIADYGLYRREYFALKEYCDK